MGFRPVNFAHLARFNSGNSSSFLDFYENNVDQLLRLKSAEKPHQTFAPSSCRCLRRSWFRIRGVDPDVPKKIDKGLQFSADLGTACHRILQNNLKQFLGDAWIDDVGKWIEENTTFGKDKDSYIVTKDASTLETRIEIVKPYPIRFACDGIVVWNGVTYLLEIKTSEFSTWNDLTDPKSEHLAQVKYYCTLLGLTHVLFLYQDRQYGELKCYEYTVTPEDMKQVNAEMKDVMDHVEWNIPPKGLPVGDKWCSSAYCPYYVKCHQWGGRS